MKEEFYIGLLLMFCLVYLAIDNTWFEFSFSLLKLKEKKVCNFEDFTFVSFFQFLNLIISHRLFDYYFLYFALFRFASHTIKNKWLNHKASQLLLS